jgi:hypothetical protein
MYDEATMEEASEVELSDEEDPLLETKPKEKVKSKTKVPTGDKNEEEESEKGDSGSEDDELKPKVENDKNEGESD